MSIPILAAKLFTPILREDFVSRPRLIDILNDGLKQNRKLTLISAPAGFGKTTLVSEWAASARFRTAWLSLEKADHSLFRFITYFVTALKKFAPGLGNSVLAMLQSSQPPPLEHILSTLLNEISLIKENFILVLDDYHLIENPEIDQILIFILDHLPMQMHVVVVTREDPAFPLSRYRVRGQLTELRTADLRFKTDETEIFLQKVMKLNILKEDSEALERRTEGWIAGLQMAGLSMQGKDDLHQFVEEFTGSHRFILDYLMEEVLQNQTQKIITFLIRTSILERFNNSLCGAVCYGDFTSDKLIPAAFPDNEDRVNLTQLEKQNLFLVALDDQRNWYRYHHVFAEVLKARLLEFEPELIFVLHQRASVWYEQNGFFPDAVLHAISGKDYKRAVVLLETIWPEMDASFQSDVWLTWVKQIPEEMVKASAVISVGYGWALLNQGGLDTCESWLHHAELLLGNQADDHNIEFSSRTMTVREKNLLFAAVAAAYAYRALAFGDIECTQKYAQRVLDFSPVDEPQWRGAALSLLGISQYVHGELEAAEISISGYYESLIKLGNIPDANSIAFVLADIKKSLGHLDEAAHILKHALQRSKHYDGPFLLGVTDLHRGLSEIYLEKNQLELAFEHLELAKKNSKNEFLTNWQYRLLLTETRFKFVQQDYVGALDLIDQAEQSFVANPLPDHRDAMWLKVQAWIKSQKTVETRNWLEKQGLSIKSEISFMNEPDLLAYVSVLITQGEGEIQKAAVLLKRLHEAAVAGKRITSEIKILVLQACVYQILEKPDHALKQLSRAITLAEPQGYVRIFMEEGLPVYQLLLKLKESSLVNSERELSVKRKTYIQKLLETFKLPKEPQGADLYLIDPLSEREVEVLRLLSSDLNGPEIANHLMVSLNTLRTHTKNIYRKLGVNNRRAAVRRAEEISLL